MLRKVLKLRVLAMIGVLAAAVVAVPAISWASHQFTDVPDSHTFHADIGWLADAGITKGCNPPANTKYCPENYVTRGQMAAFLHRLSGGDDQTLDGRLDALETFATDVDEYLWALETDMVALETTVDTLEAENKALRTLLAGVSRSEDTLLFTGMNLQIINGQDRTDTSNGLGNVIIGYNEYTFTNDRTGSHYLIIGPWNTYSSYGGIVAGVSNTASGEYASVTGGMNNTASGEGASVTGGADNTAMYFNASVSGGVGNTAIAWGSVSGGMNNTASGMYSSVLGGQDQEVIEDFGTYPGP